MDEIANDDPPSGRCRNVLSGDTAWPCPRVFSSTVLQVYSRKTGFLGVGFNANDWTAGYCGDSETGIGQGHLDNRGVHARGISRNILGR